MKAKPLVKYDKAFEYLMDSEGIYSNDPVDKGGKTIYGIASKYHPEWFKMVYGAYKASDIKGAKALAHSFYRSRFWNNNYELIEDSSLAFRIFDFGVNAGVKKSVKIFQKSINYLFPKRYRGLKIDGVFGNMTLNTCNSINQEMLYLLFTIRIYLYYVTRLTAWKHLRGWTLRLLKRRWLVASL